MKLDHKWLDKYLYEFRNKNILEIGSGLGEDTKHLSKLTKKITAIDIDEERIKNLKLELPKINFYCMDIRSKLPFKADSFDVILASLRLHYFTFTEIQKILKELKRVLKNNSIMVVRLNSINDKNYGADGHPEIEHHLFNVDGQPKRFFSRDDIHTIFKDGWEVENLTEKSIDRFEMPKVIWEFSARNM